MWSWASSVSGITQKGPFLVKKGEKIFLFSHKLWSFVWIIGVSWPGNIFLGISFLWLRIICQKKKLKIFFSHLRFPFCAIITNGKDHLLYYLSVTNIATIRLLFYLIEKTLSIWYNYSTVAAPVFGAVVAVAIFSAVPIVFLLYV